MTRPPRTRPPPRPPSRPRSRPARSSADSPSSRRSSCPSAASLASRTDREGRGVPVEPPIDLPRHLFEAYEQLARGGVTPIAGGTDLMVRITGEIGPPPDRLLDLSRVDALKGISLEAGAPVVGARATYTRIRPSALVEAPLPALIEA